MLQITFLALGLSGLLFAVAYFFKKYQRGILWVAALILFIGTSLMLGLGLIKVVDNGVANHLAVFSVILSFACSGIFACGAEKIHEASLKKASLSLSETQGKEPHEEATPEQELSKMEEIPNDNKDVWIPAKLDTPLARKVFQKALEVNLMEIDNGHYKWNGTKVQLAYMCGRIYCGDKPKYDEREDKSYWRFGWTEFFPDSELNALFEVTDLGQSRSNRKDLAVPQGSNKIDDLF